MSSAEALEEPNFDQNTTSTAPLHLLTEPPEPIRSDEGAEFVNSETRQLTPYQKELVEGHMHLVAGSIHWIQRRRSRPLDIEHARGDGSIGLCDAARRFNPTLQISFATYAPHRIRGEIRDGERREHGLVGSDKIQAMVVSLFNNTDTQSLDEPLVTGTTFTLHDVIASPDDPVDKVALDNHTKDAFYAGLEVTERQKTVYYLKARKYRLGEIAAMLGISRRTVSRDFKTVVSALFARYHPTMFE